LTALVPFAFLASGQPAADDGQGAADFLSELSRQAIEKLADTSVGEAERKQRFRELMETGFDLEAIGKFVLGFNWRRASPEQRQNFIDAFEDMQIQRFLPMFSGYAGEKLEITKVRHDESKSELLFVDTRVKRPEGEPVFIEWRLRRRSHRYQILDVKAEGVSMALTLRAEYGQVVQNHGIDGLIDRLRKKAAGGSVGAGEEKPSQ
jgi:phospholipid transport system substrate-binding protein